MALYAGKPRKIDGEYRLDDEALADSMAKAMEDAMNDVWSKMKGKEPPLEGREDRRILLSAIAQGVVNYLKQHAGDSFEVEVTQDADNITSSGTVSIGGWGTADVDVAQDEGDDNRVRSTGSVTLKIT